ncbi:MAG: peptide chain release factor N(5)-glutamine methyltransferase [Chloroflexi bacterium]|nr:peptide chain release factor N(5)-glutamine methyltransferase [Chloroflexota bacterium]MCI0855557.1 peptide chain release factor N(5)-glutamine methyltransferase [Chloroflexota bacterium]MCI0889739.1 peptide chain release factor N(5)-glutamine methyltransferase [Chloroflexota bacterium]
MTLAEALREASTRLLKASVDDPRLEAEVLLRHALGAEREQLFARLQEPLNLEHRTSYEALVDGRIAHRPTAYIIGHKEFFGLDFACSPAALIPRPDTELLVETAIEQLRERGPVLAVDLGTGSGPIAVSLATHLPQVRVVATDISAAALALARRNALAHCVASRIEFVHSSLLKPLSGRFDLIAANLPYIPSRTYNALPPEIREHEPEAALRAGRRGTAIIEAMLSQAFDRLAPGGLLLAEHGWNQGRRLREAAADHFPTADIATRRDLAGLERLLVVQTARD